jgi:hypothetical protein
MVGDVISPAQEELAHIQVYMADPHVMVSSLFSSGKTTVHG